MKNTISPPGSYECSVFAADLRCEYLRNPLGINVPCPRLSWTVCSSEPGQEQTAYQILASTYKESLAGTPDLWDSGKVPSNRSSHIRYSGKPLCSGQRSCWWLRLWDWQDRASSLSVGAWWETGLLDPLDWKADWIAGPEPSPLFRKTFAVSRQITSARLYICGQGVYEARINGRPVSDQVLGPQLSFFPVRMLYDTFDVTELLQNDQNTVAVQLVPGWFGSDRKEREEKLIKKPDPGHGLIAQLVISYADGSKEMVVTDRSWKTAKSHFEPVKSHWVHCYQGSGEHFDAEKEPFGWHTPRFNDADWANAHKIKAPTKHLCARMIEPNRIVETVRPVAVSDIRAPLDHDGFTAMAKASGTKNWSLETMTNPTFARHWKPEFTRSYNGHRNSPVAGFEVDFGKHVSGWVRMDVTGNKDDTVTMFGLDQHHLSGRPKEEVGQRFMHRAFRYVPIHFSGKEQKPRIENIRALAIQNDVRRTGRFECSNSVLNRIHDVAARTWAVHLLSGMPMDSWRERFGSALIENCESSFYWCDVGAFYTKWMTDHRDIQRPDGYFAMSGAPIAYDYWSPNWAKNAIILVPWLMYLYYGDQQAVETNYPAMRRWLELCVPKSDEGRTWQPPADHGEAEAAYGDHGRPSARWYDPHTGDLFETLHTIHCFRMAEQMAALLDKSEDTERYASIRGSLTAKVNRNEFLNRTLGLYGDGDQGCQALALQQNVVPPELRDKVVRNLIRNITETRGHHLNTGMLGTWYLLKTLIMLERPDVAVRILINKTPPSFACLLQHPDSPEELTLLPEFFGKGMIPHPGWCSVGAWFYQSLGGISPDWECPGFRRVVIRPQITKELDWVKAEYDSIAGTVRVHWKRQNGHCDLTVTVPTNSSAYVFVPATSLGRGQGAREARFLRMHGNCAVFEVAGGTHVFRSDLGDATDCHTL